MTPADIHLSPDAAVDFHLHTNYSDGTWTPEGLIDHLAAEKFGLVAITDHDRPDTISALQHLARDRNLPLLAGVEMTCTWQGEMTDLLCFGFDPEQTALSELAQDLWRRQGENTREVFFNLQQQGIDLPPEAIKAVLALPSSRQPPGLAALLRSHRDWFGQTSPEMILQEAGCSFATNPPAAVAEAAHRSGAVCLLAHPTRDDGLKSYDLPALDQFRQEVPIDGLEVYYPLHTPAQTAMFLEYARRHDLLVSAGSDSHGPQKLPVRFRAEFCRGLLERVGIHLERNAPG